MLRIEPSTEISDRVDFPLLCNARGYRYAIEIGVDMGVFARQFLSRWNGEYIHLIDPYGYDEFFPWDRTLDMLTATAALLPYHGRYKFVRAQSPQCEPLVWWKVQPQFVYIDAAHDRASVAADIAAWWSRLAPDGMLAGHDYDPDLPGVIEAVNAFAERENVVVRLTSEPDFPPSWYVYKTEPAELIHQYFRKGSEVNPHATTET